MKKILLALCVSAAFYGCPSVEAARAPDWLRTDGGSRVWLSCSGDDGKTWHRVTRTWGPGTGLHTAFDAPECRQGDRIVLRWEMDP